MEVHSTLDEFRCNMMTNDENDPEKLEYHNLQLTSSLSSWMQANFGSRVVEENALEKCPQPIALQICRESRAFTLIHFKLMMDRRSNSSPFYFSPRRDMLWLSTDILDEGVEVVRKVGSCHGEQVHNIQTCLVQLLNWQELEGPPFCFQFLDRFRGIRLVQVLLESQEFDGFEGYKVMDCVKQAQQAKTADEEALKNKGFPWTIEYVDRKGNVYARLGPKERI